MFEVETQSSQADRAIEVVSRISANRFLHDYVKSNRPLLIQNMMGDWPAMAKWSFEFFQNLGSQAEVHVESGNVMQQETDFRKATFGEFINQLMQPENDTSHPDYLSVFRIFDQFPELRNDVDFSILSQHKMKSSVAGWIGPAGTVTGYHIDWGDNILAQVCGRKQVSLVSPVESPNMYPSRKFDQGTTISMVDWDNYDAQRFPNFAKVNHRTIILHPGEMLFIPRGWWHHVRSLDRSISVSNIAFDLKGIVRDVIPHRMKQFLHNAGLWKCDCTCHIIRDNRWVRK